MSILLKQNTGRITTWSCGCTPGISRPLSVCTCPRCKKPIPQVLLKRVYTQVYTELHQEALQQRSVWWEKRRRTARSAARLRTVMLLGIVVWAVLIRILCKDFFTQSAEQLSEPVGMLLQQLVDDIGPFISAVIPGLKDVFVFLFQLFLRSVRRIVDLVQLIF